MMMYHPPVSFPHTPMKVAFLTGLSNPKSCSLHWVYQQFLANLDCPEAWKIYLNFPYIPNGEDEEKASLWQASVANARQFICAPCPRYRTAAQGHLANVVTSADALFLVVGSCGLEILNQAWTEAIARHKLTIVALGPVARSRPHAACTLIQGTHDPISRLFFKDVDVVIQNVGHMDYVHSPRVFDLVNQSLWRTRSA